MNFKEEALVRLLNIEPKLKNKEIHIHYLRLKMI